MTIKENHYIYIASNTTGSSDIQLIEALFGYVPTCTKYEMICHCTPLFSRTKFLHERSFDLIDAKRRLHELDGTLEFVMSSKGDILIYRDKDDDALRVFDAYEEYIMKEKENMLNKKIDDFVFIDPNNTAFQMAIKQSVPDKLPDITLEDLRFESSVETQPKIIGTLRVSPGVIRETRKYQFIQHGDSFNSHTMLTMPRNLGRSQVMSMLNSLYGLNGGLSYKKQPLKFKLIFGQEHATGRYKTICLWEDGEKTIIHGDNKVTKLPVAQAFAWCYVKRTFGTVSHFKKHVDKRTTKMDGVWYFEGDCIMDDYAQGSVPGTSKKRDIYDAASLAIVTKRYGGLRKLVDEYINKEDE